MAKLETFQYDNSIVKKFAYATIIFGAVGMLAGLVAALQLVFPSLSFNIPQTTFGRVRPLHTNAAIFAFVGNGIYMGVYYSLQRLLKTRMYSNFLSNFHFWGWQAIILAAAISIPMGCMGSQEYA
ncbi:MAG: cbb3-type cytochrome c oxidase subunit I, partial [Bacteroidota bacterium]